MPEFALPDEFRPSVFFERCVLERMFGLATAEPEPRRVWPRKNQDKERRRRMRAAGKRERAEATRH